MHLRVSRPAPLACPLILRGALERRGTFSNYRKTVSSKLFAHTHCAVLYRLLTLYAHATMQSAAKVSTNRAENFQFQHI